MTLMFLNGGAMRSGPLHHLLAGARFVGVVRTAPRYRFYSVGDRFPALAELPEITGPQEVGAGVGAGAGVRTDADAGASTGAGGGVSIAGELYEVPWEVLRESLLPAEPAELELGVIELEDGSGCLSMIRRRTYHESPGLYRDISDHADWRSYTAMPAPAGSTEE
ncbi:allophanate hydrolase-related protein [Actinocrinis sp.]|uniref:allophanate hydrolase-related protein n=1 Tax=Actinocrinis sp. TaxID=1920516 RepID=UPI002D230A19|nr:gamma-glutamylcyclotransferase [Actinocrinis sp.]HZP50809.1 gamma-glutamylcyclotransferase [Actinocrinis sp.]